MPIWNYWIELSTETGYLLLGIPVVIPEKLQQQVLEELLTGHPGIVHMTTIAISYNWWEGVDKDIESLV